MTYRTLNSYLKETFGTKVYKLSLSTGCTCPNRDGKCGIGGCIFCSQGGSGDFAQSGSDIDAQIQKAKAMVSKKFPPSIKEEDRRYIAYFQSFTNTYAPAQKLRPIFTAAIKHPQVVALSIATRPDCLEEEIISLLKELNQTKPVWVELGLQTIREDTARFINRGYNLAVFQKAYDALKKAGLKVIVHVIVCLPGEGIEDAKNTIRYLAEQKSAPDGIKIQLLHVLKGTRLYELYQKDSSIVNLPSLEEYCSMLKELLPLIPPQTVIHRLTGDGAKKDLVAPLWSANKKKVLNAIRKALSQN